MQIPIARRSIHVNLPSQRTNLSSDPMAPRSPSSARLHSRHEPAAALRICVVGGYRPARILSVCVAEIENGFDIECESIVWEGSRSTWEAEWTIAKWLSM